MLEYVPGNQPVLSHEGIISSSRNQLKPFDGIRTHAQQISNESDGLHQAYILFRVWC